MSAARALTETGYHPGTWAPLLSESLKVNLTVSYFLTAGLVSSTKALPLYIMALPFDASVRFTGTRALGVPSPVPFQTAAKVTFPISAFLTVLTVSTGEPACNPALTVNQAKGKAA